MNKLRTKTKKRILRNSREVSSWADDFRGLLTSVFSLPLLFFVAWALVAALWLAPIWEISNRAASAHLLLTPKERLDLENTARTTLVQFFGGSFVLIGSYFAYRNVKAVEKNIKVSEEGQITERFTKAIEQLGSDKPEIRLGGIYALERIARDSERDHWPIMEVLSSYIRSRRTGALRNADSIDDPNPLDIQAIMTVVGRRTWSHEIDGEKLDFSRVDLHGLNFRKAHLEEVSFESANLDGIDMTDAILEGSSFVNTSLQGATLTNANLDEADFNGAKIAGANLSGCNLGKPLNLTASQVYSAYWDRTTIITQTMTEELKAIWRTENEGMPEQLVDDQKAALLGINLG